MSPIDPYRVLGLSPGANEKQIKSAYRKLALKYHPDRNSSHGAEQAFHEITTAYDFLLDHPDQGIKDAPSYEDKVASEVLRKERERMKQYAIIIPILLVLFKDPASLAGTFFINYLRW